MGNKIEVHLSKAGHRLMCMRIRSEMPGRFNPLDMARFITEEFRVSLNTYQFDQDEFDMLFGDPTPEEIEAIGGSELFADVAMEPQR